MCSIDINQGKNVNEIKLKSLKDAYLNAKAKAENMDPYLEKRQKRIKDKMD